MHEVNKERGHFARALEELSSSTREQTSFPEAETLSDILRWLGTFLYHEEMLRLHSFFLEANHRTAGVCHHAERRRKNLPLSQPIRNLRRQLSPFVSDPQIKEIDSFLRILGRILGVASGRTTMHDNVRVSHLSFFHLKLSRLHAEFMEELARREKRQAAA